MKRTLIYMAIAGFLGIAWVLPAAAQVVQIPLDPAGIPKFQNKLPMLELEPKQNGKWRGGIPVLDGTTPSNVSICEFTTKILPDGTIDTFTGLPVQNQTSVWGYQIGDVCHPKPDHSYIGPVVVAQRGTPTQMTFINQLGHTWDSNVLAYTQNTDQTMHWADPMNAEQNLCSEELTTMEFGGFPQGQCLSNYVGPIPAAVHLHGGEIPPNLDGGPDSWFTFDGAYRGHGYYTREVFGLPTLPDPDFPAGTLVKDRLDEGRYFRSEGNSWTADAPIDRATYVYPNTQEAANIWFHDHVLGFTRLNVYAGIAGAYVIQDPAHTNPALGPVTNLVPIVIQDRMFDTNGELYLSGPGGNTTDEHPFWVAEFIGDVAVVNGAAWPKMKVEPKRYRFLFLNGSNSVGYNLQIATPGVANPDGTFTYGTKGPDMWVIGTDGGYLDAPAAAFDPGFAQVNGLPTGGIVGDKLVLLPGERYEVIIDFTNYAGQILEMQNDAWNPYPFGDAVPIPQIMQFQVKSKAKSAGVAFDPSEPGASPRVGDPIVDLQPLMATADVYRQLTLNEVESTISGAPLEALLNNTKWSGHQIIENDPPPHTITSRDDFKEVQDYVGPTFYSEIPNEGTMEVWDIINITADAHPIHLHLVQFQIIERIPFDETAFGFAYDSAFAALGFSSGYMPGYGPPNNYNIPNSAGAIGGNPDPLQFPIAESARGVRRGPEPHEVGWKDTAVMYPGEVTRLAVRFAPTDIPNTETDMTVLGYPFDPDDGHGYVWHCHILDHEDNEMMRPTEVITNNAFPTRGFIQGVDY